MITPTRDPGSVAPNLLNRIRLSCPRRISVRLGDLDAVFAPVTSVLGKKQRLQALGHYYEPIAAATGDQETEAYTNCLAYWQAKRERVLERPLDSKAHKAALEADLQSEIRRFIVSDGVLPAKGSEVKVRLPGTLTINKIGDLSIGDDLAHRSVRFASEQTLWEGNRALGRIPVTFKVEKWVNGVWKPAPDEWVHVELIAPFYDDVALELADLNALRNTGQRPAHRFQKHNATTKHGPRQFLKAAIETEFNASDPQRYNAHERLGGKRKLPLLHNLFDALPAVGFPNMNAPEGVGVDAIEAVGADAVRVQSNASGDGGVLFLPSRMGGDRYRMRIFLDPDGGVPSSDTMFETGRFTVWKHILWSNYLPKPAPNFPALDSVMGVQARLTVLGYAAGPIDGGDSATTQDAVRAYQANHPRLAQNGRWDDAVTRASLDRTVKEYFAGNKTSDGIGTKVGPFSFKDAEKQFRQMYCELEIEPEILAGEARRGVLTAEQYQSAIRWAIREAEASGIQWALSGIRDISTMISDEFETPFLFDIRHPDQYNRMRRKGLEAIAGIDQDFREYWFDAAEVIYNHRNGLLNLFLRYITGNGEASPPGSTLTPYSTPGLTLVAAISSTRIYTPSDEAGMVIPISDDDNSRVTAMGLGTKERAAVVFGGVGAFPRRRVDLDEYTGVGLHEIGHLLYLRHQFTKPAWGKDDGNYPEDHDSSREVIDPVKLPEPVAYDRCLMGYLPCDGDFCGKCQLQLRGWDISKMPI